MAENNLLGATAKKIKESHIPNESTTAQNPKALSKKKISLPGSKGNTTGGKPLTGGKKAPKGRQK